MQQVSLWRVQEWWYVRPYFCLTLCWTYWQVWQILQEMCNTTVTYRQTRSLWAGVCVM